MDIQIKEYTSLDQPFLLKTINKLHDFVVDIDPIKRLRKMPGYAEHELQELLRTVEKQNGRIFIATVNAQPAGIVAGFVTEQSQFNLLSVVPTKLGVISDVYVEEKFRGRQIGSKLMNAIETYLKNKGCDSIWITIVAFNTKAHSFYKMHGYEDREIGLLKKI